MCRQVETNAPGQSPETAANPVGAFSYNSGTTLRTFNFASVTDGLSNTLLYCEDAGRADLYGPKKNLRSSNTVGSASWADDLNEFGLSGCDSVGDRPGAQAINCSSDGEPYSFHSGGINVGLCDGTVRFVNQSVSMQVFAAFVTARGGEVFVLD